MKQLIASSLGLAAAMAFAFPTPSQFSTARNDVNELMRTLREDYRAKRKTAAEVADAAHGYLSLADTDAAKFLLYREVICFSAHGGDFDKAAQAVKDLESAIDDIPPRKLVDLMREALARKSREEGGALWELYRARCEQLQLQKSLEKMQAAVEAAPAKLTLRVAYAETLAQLGKWKEALDEYAKAGGVYAEYAKAEQSGKGKTFRELGDFWWGYRIRGGKVSPAMKTHAALFYKKAIDSGEATGLVARNLQNRIDEMREELEAIDEKTNPWLIDMKSREPQEMVFDFGNGVKTTFIACRGGEGELKVRMLNQTSKVTEKKSLGRVKVTRPFWVAKRTLSVSEYLLFDPSYKDKIAGFDQSVAMAKSQGLEFYMSWFTSTREVNGWAYFDWLNKTYGNRLPKGWAFRPMTIAEAAVVEGNLIVNAIKSHDFKPIQGKSVAINVLPVQFAAPGQLERFVSPHQEFLCDQLEFRTSINEYDIWSARSFDVNPFWYSWSLKARRPTWTMQDGGGVYIDYYTAHGGLRIAVGPDYVGEWKAKHAQK